MNINIPEWIDQDISKDTIRAIYEHGAESGVYMPAVSYGPALETMYHHGDDVLDYIETRLGELPDVTGKSWSGMARTYLCAAIDLWAAEAMVEMEGDQ